MAKPSPSAHPRLRECSSNGTGSSSSSIHCTPEHHPSPPHHHHRRRRRREQRAFAVPSSGFLSLLATVVSASSIAQGSPIAGQDSPPEFLCPLVGCDAVEARHQPRSAFDAVPTPTPTRPPHKLRRGGVPDKYELRADGRWHRAESVTLYGSTMCLVRSFVLYSLYSKLTSITASLALQAVLARVRHHHPSLT